MTTFFAPQVRDANTGELVAALVGMQVQIVEPGTTTPVPITEYPSGVPVTNSILTVGSNHALVSFSTPSGFDIVEAIAGGHRVRLESAEGLRLAAEAARDEAAEAKEEATSAKQAAEAAQAAAEDAAGEAQPLPVGGEAGQVLVKASSADRDVEWADAGAGTGTVQSVGGVEPDAEGNVPLTPESIGAAAATHTQDASTITSGTLNADRIPNLSAAKVTSGTFDTARIPSLDASKITSGTIASARIPTNLTAYVQTSQSSAAAGDLLAVGDDKNVTTVSVEPATAGDIDYDGETTVADRIADLLARVEALETTGPSITNTALPEISGTFEVDETVTASTGSWDPTPDSYTYQWLRDNVAIPGATSSTYELTALDLGTNRIKVRVTAVKSGHTSGVATSTAISVSADIEFVGVADEYESANTASSVELVRDGTVQEGDYLVAILGSGHNAATSDFVAQSGSGTWTRLSADWPGSGSAANRVCGIFGHVVGDLDSEPGSYVFAHTPGTATAKAGQLLVFRYVNPSDPVNVAGTDYLGTSVSNGRQTASMTVTEDNCIMLFAGWKEGSSASSTTLSTEPSGMTHIEQTVGGEVGVSSITIIESYYQEVDSGATGTKSITWSAATNPRAQAIVLQGV